MKKYFDLIFYKSTLVTLMLIVAAIILFFFLSPPIAYENGPLENLQVVQLVLGALLACLAAKKAFTRDASNIWYCGAVIFLLCAGRELNWGRVFYPLADHNDFVPLKELWYGSIVYPILTAIILGTLYMLWRSKIFAYIEIVKLPFWDLLLFIILYFAANYAEHKPMFFFGQHFDGEILEELFECLCYWLLTDIIRIMGFVNRKNIDF